MLKKRILWSILLSIITWVLISCNTIPFNSSNVRIGELESQLEESNKKVIALEIEVDNLIQENEKLSQTPDVLYKNASISKDEDIVKALHLIAEIELRFPVSDYLEPAMKLRKEIIESATQQLLETINSTDKSTIKLLNDTQQLLSILKEYLMPEILSKAENAISKWNSEIARTQYIRSKKDEMQNVVFHSSTRDTSTTVSKGRIDLNFYIVDSLSAREPYFRLRTSYSGDNWIFYKRVTLLGDNGAKIIINPDHPEKKTDVVSGGVREWSDNALSSKAEMVIKLSHANSVKIRFDGQYQVNFNMTNNQLQSLKDIVSQFQYLLEN